MEKKGLQAGQGRSGAPVAELQQEPGLQHLWAIQRLPVAPLLCTRVRLIRVCLLLLLLPDMHIARHLLVHRLAFCQVCVQETCRVATGACCSFQL